jgi:hypothetical protein
MTPNALRCIKTISLLEKKGRSVLFLSKAVENTASAMIL